MADINPFVPTKAYPKSSYVPSDLESLADYARTLAAQRAAGTSDEQAAYRSFADQSPDMSGMNGLGNPPALTAPPVDENAEILKRLQSLHSMRTLGLLGIGR